MTQEQKDLLLKDLCMRLPYGVKVQLPYRSYQTPLKILSINPNGSAWVTGDKGYPFEIDWSNCKPYLFPMSSMTEEQNLEYLSTCRGGNAYCPTYKSFDLLDKNHFDYRGLIPMGLAIDATGLNIYQNMKLWIARDADDTLCLYTTKPWKRIATEYHNNDFDCDDEFMNIDNRLFPEVTFENSPQQVELKLVNEE